jgi:hypothetical protein
VAVDDFTFDTVTFVPGHGHGHGHHHHLTTAVPEHSTWAMMLLGFAAGFRVSPVAAILATAGINLVLRVGNRIHLAFQKDPRGNFKRQFRDSPVRFRGWRLSDTGQQ